MTSGLGPLLEIEEPFVLVEQEVVSDFSVGKLEVESEAGGPTVRVIFVAEFDQKVLVCLPLGAWHSRKAANRALPPGRFQKPSKLEVASCLVDERNAPVEGDPLIVWMGYFTKDYAAGVVESDMMEEVGIDFEEGRLPFGLALKELAVEHFAFFSAAEVEAPPAESGSADLGPRVVALEQTLSSISQQLQQLVSEKAVTKTSGVRPSSLRNAKPKMRPAGTTVEVEDDFPDLDPGVVAAAKQAGIDRSTLIDMQKMVASNKKGARVLRQTTPAVNTSVLSESEDENAGGGDGLASGSSGQPVEDALAKLTTIVDHLTTAKTKGKNSALEQALDGVSSSSADGTLLGHGKRSAAARRALRAALNDSPQELYTLIERQMEEDITSQSLVPGMASHHLSARAWVEHRSHIGAFKAVAHCGGDRRPQGRKRLKCESESKRPSPTDRPVMRRSWELDVSVRARPRGSSALYGVVKSQAARCGLRRPAIQQAPRHKVGRDCSDPPLGTGRLHATSSQPGSSETARSRRRSEGRRSCSRSKETATSKASSEGRGGSKLHQTKLSLFIGRFQFRAQRLLQLEFLLW